MRLTVALATGAGVAAVAVTAVPAQTRTSQWDGVYTEAQSKRGEALYGKYCVSCHGEDLTGGGAESAPTLVGRRFTTQWDGRTLGDLFERTFVTMPQDAPGSLSREQHVDILAFVLTRNSFPAGTTELTSQPEALSAIRIVAERP